MTFLKDYIKRVLKETPKNVEEIEFDLNLYPDLSISNQPSGIKIKFKVKRK